MSSHRLQFPSSFTPPTFPMSAPPLRLALLGAGTFASSAHHAALNPLLTSNQIQIVLVWSRTSTSAESLASSYDPSPTPHHLHSSHSTPLHSIRAALSAHSDLDAAILALPPGFQEEAAAECLQLGLHVLLEKPLALDLDAANRLLSVAADTDRFLAVAENFRFEPALHAARALLSQIGDVVAARLVAHIPMREGSKYGRGWRLKLAGPGILIDGVVHHVAALRLILGEVEQVSAKCQKKASWFEGCDTVTGRLEAGGVDVALFITYACDTFAWQFSVVGTAGELIVERIKGHPGYRVSVVKKIGGQEAVESKEYGFEGIETEFRAFVASVKDSKLHPSLGATEAFGDLATVWAMYDSSESGKVVVVQKPTKAR